LSEAASGTPGTIKRGKILHEGALEQEMENSTAVRIVYDFPVAGHLCTDGAVRYIKMARRAGLAQPQGVCPTCQIIFQYQKPQRSKVRHFGENGATHF
jgi:hypothetical protein